MASPGAAHRETPHMREQFDALGVADVLVFLHPRTSLSAPDPRRLARHFVSDVDSQRAALTRHGRVDHGAALSLEAGDSPAWFEHLGCLAGAVDPGGLAALRADAEVATVTGLPELLPVPPVGGGGSARIVTWGLEMLGVTRLWEEGLSGAGVRVGHLDTGVDDRHPALRNAVAAYMETDDLGNEVSPLPMPTDPDEYGHGTHTAGTMVGRPVQGRHLGVAPAAELASAKVIEGGKVAYRVLRGLNWLIPQGVRIVNLSLGLPGVKPDFIPVIDALRLRQILVVAAVGNEGPGTSRSPGNYAGVLSVGAVDHAGEIWWRSSSQRLAVSQRYVPDVVAPGVMVVSARPGGGHRALSGTSMAAPHVAGLAALLWQAKSDATADEIAAAILGSCPEAEVPHERRGRGVPCAVSALERLTGTKLSGRRKSRRARPATDAAPPQDRP